MLKVFVIVPSVFSSANQLRMMNFENHLMYMCNMCICVSFLAVLQMEILKEKKANTVHVPCFSKEVGPYLFFGSIVLSEEHSHY